MDLETEDVREVAEELVGGVPLAGDVVGVLLGEDRVEDWLPFEARWKLRKFEASMSSYSVWPTTRKRVTVLAASKAKGSTVGIYRLFTGGEVRRERRVVRVKVGRAGFRVGGGFVAAIEGGAVPEGLEGWFAGGDDLTLETGR